MNTEPVRISWQRTPDGTPLGKAHSIDAAGRLQSAMTTRWVKGCIAVETEVRTLHELLDQAVELGGCAHRFSGTFAPGAKVNGKVLRSGGESPGATADFLKHREGPGVLCIDIDKKYQRDPWLTHKQVRDGLMAVAPWLEGVGLLVMDSSGSCIALDGQEVKGPGGIHAYALVDSAPMIKALLEDGHRRSYLAGLGTCIVSAGAGVLERSTFDLALRPPTQPDFVVPHLGSPRLSRSRPPTIFPGGRIPAKVELLSPAEVARYMRMAEAHKVALDPERRAKVEECAQARGKVAHEQLGGKLADHVAAARQAFATQTLPDDFAIPLGNGKHLTVAEMLADPSRVPKGWSLPDPLDPDYGPHRAKLDADAGVIISLAHGARRVYQLGARQGPTPDGSEPETEVGEAPVIDLSGADARLARKAAPRNAKAISWIRACDVQREAVEWIWRGRLARGKITVLEGDPGTGKTTIALNLAACISTGRPLPGEAPPEAPANVLVFSSEDDIGDTLRPRLEAAGADLTRVVFENLRDPDAAPFMLPRDLAVLEEAVNDHHASLVVIDPVMSYLDPDVDSHKDQSVRSALMPLATLCQRTHVSALLHRHLNKDSAKSALYRGGGSIAFTGVARLVLLAAKDPDDPGNYVLARTKGNLGRPPPSLSYRIGDAGDDTGVVLWGGESEHTADTLLAPDKPGPKPDTLDAAKRYLTDLLAGGPKLRQDVIDAATKVKLSASTVRRAADALGLVSEPYGKERTWRLP